MSRLISNSGVLISFLVIFTITYIPVVQTHFYFVDDYYWMQPNTSEANLNNIVLGSIASGRVFAGYFEYKIFKYVRYLQSTGHEDKIRFVGIVGITLLAYVFYNVFKTNRVKTKYAFIGSILICTLPAFQVYVSLIILIFAIYGTALASLAGLLLCNVLFNKQDCSSLHRRGSILVAVLLLVISLHFYQPASMVYWSLCLIPLILLRDEDLTRKWHNPFLIYFAVGFVSLAIHFIIVKAVNIVMGLSPFGRRGGFIAFKDVYWKIKWFLFSPLKNALNLWNISPTFFLGGVVGIIILVGLSLSMKRAVLQVIRERRYDLMWSYSQKMLLIIGIIPLSLLPNLVVTESWATYRILVALESSICILFFISLLKIEEFSRSINILSEKFRSTITPILLILLSLIVIYDAHNNVKKYFAQLHSLELQYVKNVIQEFGVSKLSETSRIYVRNPEEKYYLDNLFRFEFGQPSSNEDGGFGKPGYGEYIAHVAMYELGITKKMKIVIVPDDEPIPEDPNILFIDFTRLRFYLDERFRKIPTV